MESKLFISVCREGGPYLRKPKPVCLQPKNSTSLEALQRRSRVWDPSQTHRLCLGNLQTSVPGCWHPLRRRQSASLAFSAAADSDSGFSGQASGLGQPRNLGLRAYRALCHPDLKPGNPAVLRDLSSVDPP